MPREGLLIDRPLERISEEQILLIHEASLEILRDPGLLSFNERAADLLHSGGAHVSRVASGDSPCWSIKITEDLVMRALAATPKSVTLGSRDPANTLVMNGKEPRVYFISGSETNIWLDVQLTSYVKKSNQAEELLVADFHPRRGTVMDLCQSAHVCEHLETLDGYIRTVNIQDKDITAENKDVNKYFASLNNTTKHVMSGLTSLQQLDNVVRMAEIIVGGKNQLKENPIVSFITCLVKSPLQFVQDTTDTFLAICERGLPVVVSSAPQAGTTAPIREDGIMAQINAEVLAGITLGQIAYPGTPLLYGSVPVRARLDNLADSYGAPETSQYNVDCVQMARYYGIPCYATAGVCDAKQPGIQSSVERLFSDILVTMSGPQYLHCAYGLLDCNSIFCLLQAVLDDAHFQMIKSYASPPRINEVEMAKSLRQIREVVDTPQKLFVRHIRPIMRSGQLSSPYPFEGNNGRDSVLMLAYDRMNELMNRPVRHIDPHTTESIFQEIPGLLPRLNVYRERSQ
jgi:trimethylamine---corrinoid protein Co-methyltransferase